MQLQISRKRKLAKLAVKNPRLAWSKGMSTLRNAWLSKWDYTFGNGKAHPPAIIAIRLTHGCNLRCSMCGQPREGKPLDDIRYREPGFFKQKLSLQEYQRFFKDVASFKPTIYLWGGEPMLYRDMTGLIKTQDGLVGVYFG